MVVLFDGATLAREASGLIIGEMSVNIEGVFFPAPGWSDFAIAVLAGWADAIVDLLNGSVRRAELRFMDGPFAVIVERKDHSMWRVELTEFKQREKESRAFAARPEQLAGSILEAAARASGECRRRRWESRDTESLARAVNRLRNELARMTN